MPTSPRILTTHVGSLIRPPEIIEYMRAIKHGRSYDVAGLERVLTSAVADVVRKQAEVGIDIPSDGEFGKHGWIRYVRERLDGLESHGLRCGALAASGDEASADTCASSAQRLRTPKSTVELDYHLTNENRRLSRQRKAPISRHVYGRYWARTSDPQLVELVLSQLS